MTHGIPLTVDVLPAAHPAGSYMAEQWPARRYVHAAGVLAQGPEASFSWVRPGGLTSLRYPFRWRFNHYGAPRTPGIDRDDPRTYFKLLILTSLPDRDTPMECRRGSQPLLGRDPGQREASS
jgi:hypothetical protein